MHAASASNTSFHVLLVEPEVDSQKEPEHDAMEVLAQGLHSTDTFFGHLRKLDLNPGSFAAQQSALEKLASYVIRSMNKRVRSREDQVRELLE